MPVKPEISSLGKLLNTNPVAKLGEIFFLIAFTGIFIKLMLPLAGDNPIYYQAVIWTANVLMLIIIWIGIKLRGDGWQSFGLFTEKFTWRGSLRIFLLSLLVFVLAMLGFAIGSVIMANITGIPQEADMSGYNYFKDNVGLFIISLMGVLIVSSFGEEVIYRGFFINRLSQLGGNTKWGRNMAILISAIIFGLVHYSWGPMGMVQTGFMGLALGICYIAFKKRLIILILAHAYMDIILLVQMYMGNN